MIYDELGSIGSYRGFSRGLDVLIGWLETHDPAQLPNGKNEILEDKVFANVMDAQTRHVEDAHYEAHHKYMDVQIDLEGGEWFRTTRANTVPFGAFDEATDGGYFDAADKDADYFEGTLAGHHFVVFLPNEPHMPNLVAPGEEPGGIRKICFKVLCDAFWDKA